jgi:hypothetical protein
MVWPRRPSIFTSQTRCIHYRPRSLTCLGGGVALPLYFPFILGKFPMRKILILLSKWFLCVQMASFFDLLYKKCINGGLSVHLLGFLKATSLDAKNYKIKRFGTPHIRLDISTEDYIFI